jgi:hypothetical protein
MKIQFAVAEPHLLAEPKLSIIMGIALFDQPVAEFSAFAMTLMPHLGSYMTVVEARGDTLINRTLDGDQLEDSPLHQGLTIPHWKVNQTQHCEAEVAWVATDLPESETDGKHSYVFYGLVAGDEFQLKAMSGKIHEVDLSMVKGTPSYAGLSNDVGAARHIRGNHLLNMLSQPLWGFGQTKYGMTSSTTLAEDQRSVARNLEAMANDGKFSSGPRKSMDPEQLAYMKAVHEIAPFPHPNWKTAEQIAYHHELRKNALVAAMVKHETPGESSRIIQATRAGMPDADMSL